MSLRRRGKFAKKTSYGLRFEIKSLFSIEKFKIIFFLSEAVRLGEWDLDTTQDCEDSGDDYDDNVSKPQSCADPVVDYPVAQIIRHEHYQPLNNSESNDIALIRLQNSATFSDFIKPICLPIGLTDKNYEDVPLTVAGWGIVSTI